MCAGKRWGWFARKWGRPKRRYLGVVKEDMQEVGARESKVFDRNVWTMTTPDGKAERRRLTS